MALSEIMFTFPLYPTDLSGIIAMLHFSKYYGFHSIVPYWYNGFTLFELYPPAWFYTALFYEGIFNNILVTTYVSIISLVILALIASFYLGKTVGWTKMKSGIFFAIFFSSSAVIYLITDRPHELLAWIVSIFFFSYIYSQINRKLNYSFIIFSSLLLSILLLSNIFVFLVIQFITLGFLLFKRNLKDRVYIVVSFILSLAFTAFFWYPLITGVLSKSHLSVQGSPLNFLSSLPALISNLYDTSIATFFIMTFLIFYKFRLKGSSIYKILFMPTFFISLLFVTEIINIIPFLGSIGSEYITLFSFLGIFLLLNINFNKISSLSRKFLLFSLIAYPFIWFSILTIFYPIHNFEYNDATKEVLSVLPTTSGKFYLIDDWTGFYREGNYFSRGIYSYAPIFYNLSTPSGWLDQTADDDTHNGLRLLKEDFIVNKKCDMAIHILEAWNISHVISTKKYCNSIENCQVGNIYKTDNLCILKLING